MTLPRCRRITPRGGKYGQDRTEEAEPLEILRSEVLLDHLRLGLRTIGFRKRVVVAYAVLDETIAIIGILYGGRDHDRILPISK
jgi:plasmid stabilization system protein ParE